LRLDVDGDDIEDLIINGDRVWASDEVQRTEEDKQADELYDEALQEFLHESMALAGAYTFMRVLHLMFVGSSSMHHLHATDELVKHKMTLCATILVLIAVVFSVTRVKRYIPLGDFVELFLQFLAAFAWLLVGRYYVYFKSGQTEPLSAFITLSEVISFFAAITIMISGCLIERQTHRRGQEDRDHAHTMKGTARVFGLAAGLGWEISFDVALSDAFLLSEREDLWFLRPLILWALVLFIAPAYVLYILPKSKAKHEGGTLSQYFIRQIWSTP